jgi:hypothetical protein
MSVLIRNVPQPTDILSDSQADLENNNNAIDSSFGVDHYAASNLSANNGKHQVLQMPVQTPQPVTTVDPMFYSFQQPAGNAGILQYMCQAGGLVQSPITPIQSSAAGISIASSGTVTIFNFSSMPYCFGYFNGMGILSTSPASIVSSQGYFYWSGSQGLVRNSAPVSMPLSFSGNLLIITALTGAFSVSSFSWTLGFNRIFTPT